MSFGRPGGALDSFRVLPPDRGSFPLDHDGKPIPKLATKESEAPIEKVNRGPK